MKIKFTKKEADTINGIYNKFANNEDKSTNLKDNLVKFYMEQREGVTPEEAERVLDSIVKGVENFNKELSEALKNDSVDFSLKLIDAGKGLTNEKKYELYVNVYAALLALSANNFNIEDGHQIEDVETLAKKYAVTGEVTDEQVQEIVDKIDEALKENTFCMTTTDVLNEIEDKKANIGNLSEIVRGCEDDMRVKEATALAAYIAYQNGEIESLAGKDVEPEAIAVAAAAGIEQARSFQLFADGKINKEALLHILKIIGGVALWLSIAIVLAYIITAGSIITYALILNLLGTSLVSIVITTATVLGLGLALSFEATDVLDKSMEIASEMFDDFVSFWREKAWPKVKEAVDNAVSFFKQKKEEHIVQEATVGENGEVVLQNA